MATPTALILDATAPGRGKLIPSGDRQGVIARSFQVGLVGPGAVAANVNIYGGNDGRFMQLIMSFAVSGDQVAMDVSDDNFPWSFYQAEVSDVDPGTTVSVLMGS